MHSRSKALGFTLIELMIVVSIIGLLAAVAIPAFVKYVRRAQGAEAIMFVSSISKGSMAYYVSEHADSSGGILPRQFPLYDLVATGGRECPNMTYRCNSGNNYYTGGKFAASTFSSSCLGYYGPTITAFFEAVNFGIDDPFYYSVYANSYGGTSFMEIGAVGDLNCNGLQGYFKRFLTVNPDGGIQGSAIYTINPLE